MTRAIVFAALAGAWLTLGASSCYHAIVGTDAQAAKTVTVHAVEAACKGYALALHNAAAARKAKLLNDAQVADVEAARAEANPICPGTGGGQMPAGPADALVTVNLATGLIVDAMPKEGQ